MPTLAARLAGALLGVALLALAPAAGAVIPDAQKIADAVAEANRDEGRSDPLLLDVTLSIGDSEPLATGILASHPTGLARLELHSPQGFVEKHLLQGSEYTASRDGRVLRSPRPFLPPVFLLQATSGVALRAALSSYGVSAAEVMLGMAGERDCYVLGGRLPLAADAEERRLPSLWVDMASLEVVQVDREDGVRFRFGPPTRFDEVHAPAWISIEVPGQPVARLDVVRAARADAPAAAFGTDWLLAPASP
jgi:hypothetical protein